MLSVAVLLPLDLGENLTLSVNELELETLKDVESGLNVLALVPLTVTLLTRKVAEPVLDTVTDLVFDDPILTVPKLTEDGVAILGPEPDCCRLNVAVHDLLALIVTVPSEQSELPLHPAKVEPLAAAADRVT
jgi:hypothetical protein